MSNNNFGSVQLQKTKPLVITPGEPAGIGPDIIVQLASLEDLSNCIVIADPDLLKQRAEQLNTPIAIQCIEPNQPFNSSPGHLAVFPVPLKAPCQAGQLNVLNADYVLATLKIAAQGCLAGQFSALVTGPVHKGIINEAGRAFSGHTEFLAAMANVSRVVMMLMSDELKVALATTHIPLSKVSPAITQPLLAETLRILRAELIGKFAIANPRILVCGLNPHAGEGGHLGREEIDIIIPVINQLKAEGFDLAGPFPADTIFIPKYLQNADVVLAMYHDQGLPVLKYAAFNHVVNVTLGLPFIRTSVDHGVALDLAGTGSTNIDSFRDAIKCAQSIFQLVK